MDKRWAASQYLTSAPKPGRAGGGEGEEPAPRSEYDRRRTLS